MFPEIGSIGPVTIHSYGLLIAVGVFLSLLLMTRRARKNGFPSPEQVFDFVFVIVVFGFLGARLFYIVQEWDWYRSHPLEIVQIWKGGLVYYGGMITSFIAFFLSLRSARLPYLRATDFVIPFVALSQAFGRVGCFLNGCCYGKFSSFLGRIHPVQLYESFFDLVLFGFLSWLYRRPGFPGRVTAAYLLLYPAGRFFIEFFRGDQSPFLFSLTLHQVLSLIFLGGGGVLYGASRRAS